MRSLRFQSAVTDIITLKCEVFGKEKKRRHWEREGKRWRLEGDRRISPEYLVCQLPIHLLLTCCRSAQRCYSQVLPRSSFYPLNNLCEQAVFPPFYRWGSGTLQMSLGDQKGTHVSAPPLSSWVQIPDPTLPSTWYQTSYLTSCCLHFLICEVGTILQNSLGLCEH